MFGIVFGGSRMVEIELGVSGMRKMSQRPVPGVQYAILGVPYAGWRTVRPNHSVVRWFWWDWKTRSMKGGPLSAIRDQIERVDNISTERVATGIKRGTEFELGSPAPAVRLMTDELRKEGDQSPNLFNPCPAIP
ncbi:hypothetical protein E3N88_02608 [Mikania micrantha]|uniref:Uncharacterized protein n=1 Tax=Mikania micrantha TaxID=192012 RepID=A0A5N6Q4G8_9ASTR|nr:hypothetical protein E3N88_02608 [Mikania micrantha]